MRFAIVVTLSCVVSATHPSPYAAKHPLPTPEVFEPGVISTGDFESHPTFTPDGKTLYFLKDAPNFSFWTMMVSRFENGKWQEPSIAPWSGRYRDAIRSLPPTPTVNISISSPTVPSTASRKRTSTSGPWSAAATAGAIRFTSTRR
jgi:hypothetical protein